MREYDHSDKFRDLVKFLYTSYFRRRSYNVRVTKVLEFLKSYSDRL